MPDVTRGLFLSTDRIKNNQHTFTRTFLVNATEPFSKQLTDAEFVSAMKKTVKYLSWQDGYRMPTDADWPQTLTSKDKVDTFNKKWGWKRTLGSCELVPVQEEKQRKQIYAVLVHEEQGKQAQRYFFKTQLQAEIFVYLHELNIRAIKPSQQDIIFLSCNNQAPDWYQINTDLPLI